MLEAAAESGVTFFDTADVYGDGRSEQTIAAFLSGRPGPARAGRHQDGPPRRPDPRELRARQLPRLERPFARATSASTASTWCSCTARRPPSTPPTRSSTPSTPSSRRSASRRYGVSVETCAEALTAIARPGRGERADHPQRLPPEAAATRCCPAAPEAGVGIIARVPLASGLLSGKYTKRHRLRRRTTTAPTTGTARPSTWARPSPASTTPPASRPRAEFAGARPRGVHPGPARPALDHPAARRHHRDPRRPLARAGPRQRGRRPSSPTLRADPRRGPRPLRPADQGAGRGPLVDEPGR